MPPFVATDRHRLANAAPASVTINMANLATTQPGDATKSKVETLFGPPVGVGGTAAPEWTSLVSKEDAAAGEEDELTMDVVQEWVKRSKDEVSRSPSVFSWRYAFVRVRRRVVGPCPGRSAQTSGGPRTAPKYQAGSYAVGLRRVSAELLGPMRRAGRCWNGLGPVEAPILAPWSRFSDFSTSAHTLS